MHSRSLLTRLCKKRTRGLFLRKNTNKKARCLQTVAFFLPMVALRGAALLLGSLVTYMGRGVKVSEGPVSKERPPVHPPKHGFLTEAAGPDRVACIISNLIAMGLVLIWQWCAIYVQHTSCPCYRSRHLAAMVAAELLFTTSSNPSSMLL